MPLLKPSDPLPEWSDIDFIEIIRMKAGDSASLPVKSVKERYFIAEGFCNISFNKNAEEARAGDFFTLIAPADSFNIDFAQTEAAVIRIGGRWGNETGSSGLFSISNSRIPKNPGDPVNYPRLTEFDNHFHDCDEFWIILKGSGLAVSEGVSYELGPDLILATKTGDHHDLPIIYEEIKGVWFESTLKGEKRRGHLWNHTHTK